MSITPKNWETFQHYKDRCPPWIKLHRGLLDNVDYYRLSPEAAKALPLIWLIASERDGVIPAGAELGFRLRIPEELANDILLELIESRFLVEGEAKTAEQGATLAQLTAKSNGFGSRHISDETKRVVWARDGGKCCQCSSEENVEYDHKHPVSKGGNSEKENIQLLCRPCNRSKRTKAATRPLSRRSLETEVEDIEKRERKNGAVAPLDPAVPEREFFERGKEVLGKGSGGLIAKLLKVRGGNVALARAAIEQASQKQNPLEYVAAICRGPPMVKPQTAHQAERQAGREILDDIGKFISGGGSEADSELLRHDTGDGSQSIRGGTGGNLIDLSPSRTGTRR